MTTETPPVLGQGDVVAALVEYLLDDADLHAAVGGRGFGFELPADQADDMPRTCFVVQEAGGFHQGLPEVLDRARVDANAYGRSLDEAKAVAVMIRGRMRDLSRFVATNGLVLLPATRSGGYIPLREEVGGWPRVLRSYLVVYDERSVA